MRRGHDDHHNGREQGFFRRLLNQLEREDVAPRAAIEALVVRFFHTHEPMTPEDLVSALRTEGVSITNHNADKLLRTLESYGLARSAEGGDGQRRYEHIHIDEHSDHLICLKCGRDIAFTSDELERAQQQAASRHNFRELFHQHRLYGLCEDCVREHARPLVPLRMILPGERAIIEQVAGGRGMRERFASMGLAVGDEIRVAQRSAFGQMVVQAGQARIAIGRQFSNRIIVSLLPGQDKKE